MNREALNWWLTLSANVGVLAGLVFVGLEIQQNTKQLQAEASFTLTEIVNEQNAGIYENAELAELLMRGEQDLATLNPVELKRFSAFQYSRLNTAEYMEDLRKRGLADFNFQYIESVVRQYHTRPGLQAFIRERRDTYVGSQELLARLIKSDTITATQ